MPKQVQEPFQGLPLPFPGGPVVKTSPSNALGISLSPGYGVKIPHISWPKN